MKKTLIIFIALLCFMMVSQAVSARHSKDLKSQINTNRTTPVQKNAQTAEVKLKLKNCQNITIYEKCPHKKNLECKKWLEKEKTKYCKNPEMLKKHILEEFSKWDKKLKTLSLDFTRVITYPQVDLSFTIDGKIYYEKPKKLRLDHTLPEPQKIWTDKNEIIVYKPKTNESSGQATKSRWNKWLANMGKTYIGILDFGNQSKTIKEHNIEKMEFTPEVISLLMTPKVNPDSYKLTLSLSKANLFPCKILFEVKDMISDITVTEATLKINEISPKDMKDIMKIDTEGVKIEEI